MTMNDDFLYRMRAEPSPYFIASLKARLNQLDKESLTRVSIRRRVFFLGSIIIAGVAIATGLFVARTMYSPPLNNLRPIPVTNPSPADDQHTGFAPKATHASPSAVVNTAQEKAAAVNRTPGQFRVGATVSIYPNIKEAVRFMNKNMNLYPPFQEPTLSMMSENSVFASLCSGSTSVEVVVVDRRIIPEELEVCRRINKHISEIKVGYEAIVLARSNLYDAPRLSTQSIFLALAREIPNPLHPEELIKNPNVTWDQIDSTLPNERIDVSGPPLSAATGIAFRDLVMKAGCTSLPTIALLKGTDPERFEEVCGSVRTDGAYRVSDLSQISSNPFDFVGYLQAHPEAIALLAYRQELLRAWKLAAGSIAGVAPSDSTISSGSYPGARALYLYANTTVPHMRNFVLAIWSSVGGPSDDTPLISVDAEQPNLRPQVLTLPDLKF
jgi:phosphate transport system substrate-binding protein